MMSLIDSWRDKLPMDHFLRRRLRPIRAGVATLQRQLKLTRSRLGAATHECPVCGCRCRFESFGDPPRPSARCPRCGALERHRLLWFFMCNEILPGRKLSSRILHCAPEPCLGRKFRALPGIQYVSVDLSAHNVTAQMDLTNLGFRDETFDVVVCNHVLEHIRDDRKAMREILRVTKVNGIALLNVPHDVELHHTYEDWSIVTTEGRRKAFGQHDHVRVYSRRDYARRLREAGWTVTELSYADRFSEQDAQRFGLPVDDARTIFRCDRR
jgi:SAM-dependent methyltransferase